MVNWYTDEGLDTLIMEWKREHRNAVVYKIADKFHSQNPDVSQHAPDKGGSKPGDDKGEVDAGDFMLGNGVTVKDLDELAEGLRQSKDKRIMYVIWGKRIFSSVTIGRISPFVWRTYNGKRHDHVHVSMNDNFANDRSDWKWEKMAGKNWTMGLISDAKLPEKLSYGDDDDAFDGYNHVMRMQALLNLQNNKGLPRLDTDGVYGANTVQMVKAIYGGDGRTVTLPTLRKLHGI